MTKFKNGINKLLKKLWDSPIAFCTVIPVFMTLLIESLSRHSFFGGFVFLFSHPLFFIMNCLLIASPLSLTFLTKKRFSFQFLVLFVFFVLGAVNFVLLFTRITPFEAVDLSILRTGISIVNVYLSVIEIILCAVAILLAITGAVFLFVKLPKRERKIKKALPSVIAFTVLCALMITLTAELKLIPKTFSDKNEAYDTYGFTYCFMRSIFDRGIPEPKDYSEMTIDEILSSIGEDKTNKVKEPPNIIMVQLESFMDPAYFKNLTFEKDPVPNYRKLKEEGITGILSVPSVGSGTANTEFEVLCGMSLDYFGTGEYPYKTILQTRNCETVCYDLAEQGYTCHAFHNHTGTFYNRNIVYNNLGFDTFTPIEFMTSYDVNPLGWAKDAVLTDYITAAAKSTEGPDFLFAVSVQGHGKYPESPAEGEELIKADGAYEENLLHQYEYYAQQLYETDLFIGELTEFVSQSDEKYVIVLYGDHQPSIEYNLSDISLSSKHDSEYVIWTNYKNEHDTVNIESYQLYPLTLKQIGINNGIITKLHQNYSDSPDYISALEMLEYDMLYGDMLSYGGKSEYKSHDMKMGLFDMTVSRVSAVDGTYYVIGTGFSKSSQVYINGDETDTVFISDGVLIIGNAALYDGDIICVHQITNDFVDLGSSDDFVFSEKDTVSIDITPPEAAED